MDTFCYGDEQSGHYAFINGHFVTANRRCNSQSLLYLCQVEYIANDSEGDYLIWR